jgi:hypothetical protein
MTVFFIYFFMHQNIFLWRSNAMVADGGDGPEVLFLRKASVWPRIMHKNDCSFESFLAKN